MMLLKIEDLTVSIDQKLILNKFNLTINKGEIHAIMGPNGCGKSTLSKTIMGDTHYTIKEGKINFNNIDITNMATDERARLGLFLGMQSPIEIEGVSNIDFLRTALSVKKEGNINLYQFVKQVEDLTNNLKIDSKMINRSINVGFSGGERKKNEVLQMRVLEPSMVILDEIDSGLDVDSLKIVADNINLYQQEHPEVSILIITHYPRILQYIKPHFVHIMTCGKIVKTGDYQLALTIEDQGYANIKQKDSEPEIDVIGESHDDE